ncbi:hypothetical protein FKV25_03260 [Lysobacter aestuarii]|uniref:Uncharacterized protein n=1 Tax=Marilutibacter aestuarii TaxID=1706195 RepID=A0A508ASW3_9GAMM|nr:hypothetical protein FKV25_03260 [Lysobacter aestuarii]
MTAEHGFVPRKASAIARCSPITHHPSPITHHPSPITNHQSPPTHHSPSVKSEALPPAAVVLMVTVFSVTKRVR